MAEPKNYVVVSAKNPKVMIGGPYLWNGKTEWTPPEDGILMLEEKFLENKETE